MDDSIVHGWDIAEHDQYLQGVMLQSKTNSENHCFLHPFLPFQGDKTSTWSSLIILGIWNNCSFPQCSCGNTNKGIFAQVLDSIVSC